MSTSVEYTHLTCPIKIKKYLYVMFAIGYPIIPSYGLNSFPYDFSDYTYKLANI